MSKVEEVARAIFTTWADENGVSETWEEIVELGHPYVDLAYAEARAAIEAMREPTVAMHMAAVAGYTARDGRCRPAALRDAYDAWIGAALYEQVTG